MIRWVSTFLSLSSYWLTSLNDYVIIENIQNVQDMQNCLYRLWQFFQFTSIELCQSFSKHVECLCYRYCLLWNTRNGTWSLSIHFLACFLMKAKKARVSPNNLALSSPTGNLERNSKGLLRRMLQWEGIARSSSDARSIWESHLTNSSCRLFGGPESLHQLSARGERKQAFLFSIWHIVDIR